MGGEKEAAPHPRRALGASKPIRVYHKVCFKRIDSLLCEGITRRRLGEQTLGAVVNGPRRNGAGRR